MSSYTEGLPVILLEVSLAKKYARHILIGLEREPLLFDTLDSLVAVRDFTFHQGRTKAGIATAADLPEVLERRLLLAWAALHIGYTQSPPPM